MKREYPTVRAFSFVVLLLFGLITSCTETSVSEPEPWTYTKSYWNIHIMDSDGSNIKNLTNNTDHTWLVDVSPLGSKIIFRTNGSYTMNLDGTDKILLSNSFYLQFSPDETKVLYLDPGSIIFIMNSDGTNKKCLAYTTTISHIPEPKFSPNGLSVVYTSSDSIYTVDIEGNNRKYLTRGDYPSIYS